MQIPGFKKRAVELASSSSGDHLAEGLVSLVNSQHKALPVLAVLSIYHSPFLCRLYQVFYCALALSLWLAIAPYLMDVDVTLISNVLYVIMLLAASGWFWRLYSRQSASIPVGLLTFQPNALMAPTTGQGAWIYADVDGEKFYQLAGEVLCWPWLVILPLRSGDGGTKNLIIAADALEPADQARLRTWLRACLKPKG